MAAKKDDVTFWSLINDIKAHKFQPIYVLHGEEGYFIDKIEEAIINNALQPHEQDFNLNIIYGVDVDDMRNVIAMCRQFPAMAERQVVIIREAQNVGKLNNKGNANELNQLKHYALQPSPTTVLVVCYKDPKGGNSITAKEFLDAVKKNNAGVIFRSNRLREGRELDAAILEYVKRMECSIDDKALAMIADNVGNDISRLYTEIDKLKILVGPDKRITPELIERNIGVSKDYNSFELEDALANRNAKKAFEIIDHYERIAKQNYTIMTLSVLFSYFSKLILFNSAKDRSPAGLMTAIGTKSSFRVRKFEQAARHYNNTKCVRIISWIRECDTKGKGMGSRQNPNALLRELIYKILFL